MGRSVVYEHQSHPGQVYASLAVLRRTLPLILSPEQARQLGAFLLDERPDGVRFLAETLIDTANRVEEPTLRPIGESNPIREACATIVKASRERYPIDGQL